MRAVAAWAIALVRTGLLGTLLALAACGSGVESWPLRAGVVQIYAGAQANDFGCAEHDPAQCPNYEGIFIADVDSGELCPPPEAACGSRLAVLTTRGGGWDDNPLIHVSDDAGLTWRTIVPEANLYSDSAWDSFTLGVHVDRGEIYLLYSTSSVGGGGLTYSRLHARRVDQVTGILDPITPSTLVTGSLAQHRPDGRLRWMVEEYDFRDSSRWPSYVVYDPRTGDVTGSRALTCAGARIDGHDVAVNCSSATYNSPNRGDYFDGYTRVGGPVCRYSFHVDDPDGRALCMPRRLWPGTDGSASMPTAYLGAVPWAFWSDEGLVRAAAIVPASAGAADSGAVTAVVEFGPGATPRELPSGRMHRPRWSSLVAIPRLTSDAGRGEHDRLVDLGEGDEPIPQEVVFPDSPCSGSTCGYVGAPDFGYRLAQWITRVSQDEYLVFYVVQSASNDNQQTLYVSREKPKRVPIVAAPPAPFDPDAERPPLAYPDHLAMAPLERACVRLASCGYLPPERIPTCVTTWATESPRTPALAQVRASFIAATSCDALADFGSGRPDQHHCGTICATSGGDCTDGSDPSDGGGTDVAASCDLLYSGAEACDSCLPDGRFVRCGQVPDDGPQHYAVPCADFALSCATCNPGAGCLPGCVPPEATCTTSAGTCEGAVWTRCTPGTTGRLAYDCGALGAACDPASGCVDPPSEHAKCFPSLIQTPLCLDQYRIATCQTNRPHYADCRALGFQGCETVLQTVGDPLGGVARCW